MTMRYLLFTLVYCTSYRSSEQSINEPKVFDTPTEEGFEHWMNLGKKELNVALERYRQLTNKKSVEEALRLSKFPKNVVIFVGDGMSMPTISGARILKGQKLFNASGEEQELVWEKFTETGFIKTYNTDKQTGDSAATAVAMFTGVKAVHKTLGFTGPIVFKKPSSEKSAEKLTTILDWAQEAGMKTGFVTTTRITHATPAALYAHSASRDWECDAAIIEKKVLMDKDEALPTPDQLADIARQLVENEPGNRTDVIFGGGYLAFKAIPDYEPKSAWDCMRKDGRDLTREWCDNQASQGFDHRFVSTASELREAIASGVPKVFGLFAESHMSYEYQRPDNQPSLTEMATSAVNILKKTDTKDKGFFLMVEGGRIDHAHHDNMGKLALDETVSLDNAVEKVQETLKELGILDETLIIVTADHGHTMNIVGYPERGQEFPALHMPTDGDGIFETSITYANGPSANASSYAINENGACVRVDPSKQDYRDMKYQYPALAYRRSESHGSEDVGIWASGPMAFLFHKTHEQSYVGHVIAFVLKIGHFRNDPRRLLDDANHDSQESLIDLDGNTQFWLIVVLSVISVLMTLVSVLLFMKIRSRHRANYPL